MTGVQTCALPISISAARLAAAIAQVLANAATARATKPPPPAPPPSPSAPRGFDPSPLAALVGEIGPGATAEVIRQFQADAQRQVEDMRELAAAGRMDLLGHQARLVARAARTVGLAHLAQAAAAIQQDVAAGSYDGMRPKIDALEPLVLAGLDALRRWHIPA